MAVQTQDPNAAAQVKPAMTPPTQPGVQHAPTAPTPTPAPTAPGLAASPLGPTSPTPTPQPAPVGPTTPTPTPVGAAPGLAPAGAPFSPTGPSFAGQSPAPSLAPAAATSQFGPGNDLRTTQISPTTDPRLAATQGDVNSAASKLTNGPDRFAIAQDRFNQAAAASEPAYQASIRAATQKAAANGAIGSGMLGTDYGNLALAHTRDLEQQQKGMLSDALEGTIGDNRANVGLLSGLEGQQYAEGANDRGELRGERGYQNGMENQAYNRGVQGVELGNELTNSAFGRGLATSQFGAQGNPAATQLGLAGMYGQQASEAGQSVGQLAQANAQNGILQQIYGQKLPQAQPTTPPVSGDILNSIYNMGH